VFLSVLPVMAGYILLKGWFLMMGTTTGLAPALFVVRAAGTKQHGGALVDDEVEVMTDPFAWYLGKGERSPHHNPYRIYSFTWT